MTETDLYVDSYDARIEQWTTQGTSPYLNAQDEPTNIVYVSKKNLDIGDFGFPDLPQEAANIISVVLWRYVDEGTEQIDCYLWDGTVWVLVPFGGGKSKSYGWQSVNVTSILDTVAKVNGAKLYLRSIGIGGWTGSVYADCVYLKVNWTGIVIVEKGFSDTGHGSDIFGVPFKEKKFAEVGEGTETFGVPLKEKQFGDVGGGMESFVTSYKEKSFVDIGAGEDVFQIVYRELRFSDVGVGADSFSLLLEKAFEDIGLGTDVFEKIMGIIDKAFSDLGTGIDTFQKEKVLPPIPKPPVLFGGRFPPEEKEYDWRILGSPFLRREINFPLKIKLFSLKEGEFLVSGKPFRTGEQEFPIKGRRDSRKLFWLLFGDED